jgi:hemolysin activation/secretion protein
MPALVQTLVLSSILVISAAVDPGGALAQDGSDYAPKGARSANKPAEAKPSQGQSAGSQNEQQQPAPAPVELDIDEYVIEGVDLLPQDAVERAVYPHLGPKRTSADVEKARASLEKAYQDRGFQTISVEIPPQNAENGIVRLKVVEAKVGRLSVNNAKFFSPEKIRQKAPSLEEGKVPNFKKVQEDLVALNQWPDRRVTPSLQAGVTPGTIDVNLNVEDTFPLHGSIEFNNRGSSSTTPYRLSTSLRYDNLWQLGHSISYSYSVAPERPDDAESVSISYLMRFKDLDFFNLLFYGVHTNSDVTTVGNVNVVGPGQIYGIRGVYTLPARDNLFHSLNIGIDYKHFDEVISLSGLTASETPIEYYPITALYSAFLQGDGWKTEFNVSAVAHVRGMGSDFQEFDEKRFGADPSFFYVKGDIAVTKELVEGAELYIRTELQLSASPLVSSEQFSVGGQGSVRGYFESEALGDNGVSGTLELRSPNIAKWLNEGHGAQASQVPGTTISNKPLLNEWRVYAFADGAFVTIQEPLAEQVSEFGLASIGLGSRVKFFDHLNGSVDFAVPLTNLDATKEFDSKVLFRAWGEF